MPLNTTTDKNVNEIAVETGNNSVLIQYADYHYFSSITGSALPNYNITPYNSIPQGLAPSYSLPETISCLGHWQSSTNEIDKAGFVLKIIVVKTVLNSSTLLNQYLGYIPDNGYTVAMYDFLAQVTLQSGFGSASNKTFLMSIHRGFSRHKRNNVWYGDGLTTGTVVGVYDVTLSFGFDYNFQPVRTDNIYSDSKFVTVDPNSDPPTKYLDIYETITGPIVSSFKINNNTNKPATANFVNTTTLGERTFGNIARYTYTTTNKIDRATYTLGLYVKTTGEDKRVYATASGSRPAGWYYSTNLTTLYRNNGSIFDGKFETTNAAFILQNRSGLQCGEVKVINPGNANSVILFGTDRATYPAGTNGVANVIRCRYYINAAYSSGYSILSNTDDVSGANLCFPKRVNFNSYLMDYDREHDYTNDPVYFRMSMPVSKAQTSVGVDHCPVRFGPFVANTTIPNTFGTSSILRFTNFNSKSFISQKTRVTSSFSTNSQIFNINFEDTLQRNYLGKKLISLNLNPRNAGFANGAALNRRDQPNDGKVMMRGEMLPAYVHKKSEKLSLKSLVVIDGIVSDPGDSITFIRLNNYRYLNFKPTLKAGLPFGNYGFRLTIWEAAGTTTIEKYWDLNIGITALSSSINIDLMFPNYPGVAIDDQDDPYPRVTSELSISERKNNPYYGCNRIVKIDISSAGKFDTGNFDCFAFVSSADLLNFVPSLGSDSNLKKLDVAANSSTYGRRFLLMRQQEKPEEETDLVYDSNTKLSKNLTVSEFVDRLNKLHDGMISYAKNGSVAAYLMQGLHYNYSVDRVANKRFDQTRKTIEHRVASFVEKNSTIYYSEIFQGLYLDFPPFLQDLFKFESLDLWLTTNKRRPSTSTFDIDLKIYCNLRGYLYGSQTNTANNTPIGAKRDVFLYQYTPLPEVQKGATVNSVLSTFASGFYSTGRPHAFTSYDYGTSSFNKARCTFTTTQLNNIVKLLPSKITRLSYGSVQVYKSNPYGVPLGKSINYINVAEGKLKNEFTAVLSTSLYPLSPFVNLSLTTQQKATRSSAKIVNINTTGYEYYDLKISNTSNIEKIIGFNAQVLNQNKVGNRNLFLLNETYIFPQTETLVLVNKEFNDSDHWYFYDDVIYSMANIFKTSDNNSYVVSRRGKYIYSAGTYQNYLVLQSTTLDMIRSTGGVANFGSLPPDPRYSLYLDGYNSAVNLASNFPTIEPYTAATNAGIIAKSPSLVCPYEDQLVIFYTKFNQSTNLLYCLVDYLTTTSNIELFKASDFCVNTATNISNINSIYDPTTNKISLVFQVSLNTTTPNINIFYTEMEYKLGVLKKPTEFHHIAGTYNSTNYKSNVVFYNTSNNGKNIPYQKVGLYKYSNSTQKGEIGIFYVDNNGALFNTSIIPFDLTNEAKEIK